MKYIIIALFLILAVNVYAVEAIITFTDNSDNEQGFRVDRRLNSGVFISIATLGANVNQLIDTTLIQSTMIDNKYCYRVSAFNAISNSAFANTEIPGVTDCILIRRLITILNSPSFILVK